MGDRRGRGDALDTVARVFIVIALAAVGMSIHFGELRGQLAAAGGRVHGRADDRLWSLVAISTLGLGDGIGP